MSIYACDNGHVLSVAVSECNWPNCGSPIRELPVMPRPRPDRFGSVEDGLVIDETGDCMGCQ